MHTPFPLSPWAVLVCAVSTTALCAPTADVASGAPPCEPAALAISFDDAGLPIVRARGSAGVPYRLEGSTDLNGAWLPLLEYVGETSYTDPQLGDLPARFYRASCLDGSQLSQNAVGYVRILDPHERRAMAAGCFDGANGAVPTVSRLIGGTQDGQIPAGTTVHVWNGERYESATRGAHGWINDPLVERGHGFWIEVPDAPGDDGVLYMIGEVPDALVTPLTDLHDDLIANPYPTSWVWGATGLAQSLPVGASMTVWNGSDFVTSTKSPIGWTPNLVIPLGEAGFLLSGPGEPVPYNGPKPYTWP